ncbi:hypothetical protein [Bhargavaea massiliensis]|uniref:hypothetical protein n=1 Tax=Bhargavaea massiliensis TaxID=2697500 RepID=UPI001BCCF50A|nr:hypothetical protein [Bhargavaea massiliensis]
MDNFFQELLENVEELQESLTNNTKYEPKLPELTPEYTGNGDSIGNIIEHLQYKDPLVYASSVQFESFSPGSETHFVKPHYVNGYVKADGTVVNGYFRDGDGNSLTNLSVHEGGGYTRSNPDGNPFNNLNREF